MRRSRVKTIIIGCVALLLFYLCIEWSFISFAGISPSERFLFALRMPAIKNDLSSSKLLWETKQVSHYQITVTVGNFVVNNLYACSNITDTLTVKDEKVIDASLLSECKEVYDELTIEKVFARVENDFVSLSPSIETIEVQFDPDYGFISRYVMRFSGGGHPILIDTSNLIVLGQ